MAGDILDNRGRGVAAWSWPAVHPEGRKFALAAAALCAGSTFMAWETLAWPLGALVLGILAFFRDPRRVTPLGENLVVAPADGLITLIKQLEPPRELVSNDGTGHPGLPEGPVTRVSIFMSVFDVTSTARRLPARWPAWSISPASFSALTWIKPAKRTSGSIS